MTQVAEVPVENVSPSPDVGRIVSLDAVRGAAVLMVMFHHFAMTGNLPEGRLSQLFGAG